jgi:hypothetical protein
MQQRIDDQENQVERGAAIGRTYTDEELLDMRPDADADHATWYAWHKILFEHGKLTPPEPVKE